MTYSIRFLEKPPLHPIKDEDWYNGTVDFSKLSVGDLCCYHYRGVPCTDSEHLSKLHLSAYYFANNTKRPPLILALPSKLQKSPLYFLVDGQCFSEARGYYGGWQVRGKVPLITITPSVNFVGHYHGHIVNGVIGPDV